jgi:hypothetical protein
MAEEKANDLSAATVSTKPIKVEPTKSRLSAYRTGITPSSAMAALVRQPSDILISKTVYSDILI